MPSASQSYRQHLPALDLSIERLTERVPGDGSWYLLRSGEQIGRFRSLKAAQAEWDRVVEASGWSPEKRPIDADAAMRRESVERWARNRGG